MKQIFSMILAIVMVTTLSISSFATDVTPTAPSWVKAEEYVTFPGDTVYSAGQWAMIQRLRADAAAGHAEPQKGSPLYDFWKSGRNNITSTAGLWFELGLIGMKYTANKSSQYTYTPDYFAWAKGRVWDKSESYNDPLYQLLELWYMRARLLRSPSDFPGTELKNFLGASPYTMEDFRDCECLSSISEELWAQLAAAKSSAELGQSPYLELDGRSVGKAVVRSGRSMVAIRHLAELLGAQVDFVKETRSVRIERAGTVILMPIGKTTATVNGKSVQMDVAPYIENGTTYVPVRYAAELLGQKVEWSGEFRCASVTENKAAAGDTNLEAWALAMGAVQNYLRSDAGRFGGWWRYERISANADYGRSDSSGNVYPYERARDMLSSDWAIDGRKALIETVCYMTEHGHNEDFQHDVAMIQAMTPAEYQTVLNNAAGADKYMFPYTKQLGQKWGEKGILAWDLFRMSNLVQWGYEAGYVTYPEALALLQPAAQKLHDTFSNWDEAYNNYLDGYYWWAREDMLNKDPWKDGNRGVVTESMMLSYKQRLMDDTLFQTPVTPVTGITADQLLASVQ